MRVSTTQEPTKSTWVASAGRSAMATTAAIKMISKMAMVGAQGASQGAAQTLATRGAAPSKVPDRVVLFETDLLQPRPRSTPITTSKKRRRHRTVVR